MVARADLYLAADELRVNARREERQVLLDLLAVEAHHVVCDVPAWGGYLAEGIDDPSRVICVEPSAAFADLISTKFQVICAAMEEMPLPDASVDRVGSMVGLHHLPDKFAFVQEAARILKPGGRIVLSEVLRDSGVAHFLNGPVNRLAFAGHHGKFVRPDELTQLLSDAGFTNISEAQQHLVWRFTTDVEMVEFCRCLLGLRPRPAAIATAIQEHFAVRHVEGEVHLPWSLRYAVGEKR